MEKYMVGKVLNVQREAVMKSFLLFLQENPSFKFFMFLTTTGLQCQTLMLDKRHSTKVLLVYMIVLWDHTSACVPKKSYVSLSNQCVMFCCLMSSNSAKPWGYAIACAAELAHGYNPVL